MFFSIKNKIVFALIAILISVTGFNVTYSYLMFKGDKEAYIFENSLRSSELANEKILEYIKENSKLLAKNTIIKDDIFFFTGEFIQKNATFIFYYNDNSFKSDENKLKAVIKLKSSKVTDKILIHPYLNYILMILKQDNGYRFALIDKEPIIEMLSKDNIFQYIVSNDSNKLYYGNKKLLPGFKNVVVGNSLQGSTSATSNNQDFLVSYSKLKRFGLTTFSYISQDSAFAIFKDIIFKNVSFTVIILGFFLILSILFTKKITNPILSLITKTEEIAKGNFSGTIEVTTNDELKTLGSSVNNMSSQIMKLLDDKQEMIKQLEVANKKLDDYNKNLESIVKERTKELSAANTFITAMINSLDQGLFVFNQTKKCLDIFTNACETMFNKIPKGLDVIKLLGLNTKEVEAFDKWSNVIFSNMMPFESAKSLGPKNITRSRYGRDDFQFIELDYYPMNDEDGNLENVVAVATDKTEQVEAEERFKEKDAYVTMILNIIKNKKAFYDFIDEMDGMLTSLSDFSRHEDLTNIAMIAFHSMNGGYANYSVSHLVHVARESETQIKSFLGNRIELENLLIELINNFKSEQTVVLEDIEKNLGDSKNKVEIDKTELAELQDRMAKGEDPNNLFIEYFKKEKISSIFTPYSDLISRISTQLGKPMVPMFISGGNLRIDTDQIREFSSALVHLFRNCMDHGIESIDKRLEAGKPEEGSIDIKCSMLNETTLRIIVKDDGAGINIEKIREILEGKGIDQTKLSDKQAMMYIFEPDFSTAEKLTELSGRGVGMSAVAQAIKNLNGNLDLISEIGKGSQFIFDIPVSS